jgi:hypothetical protein
VEEIRSSVLSYVGGECIPGRVKNVSKAFLQPLYHKWTSSSATSRATRYPLHKPRNSPHIKTYYQLDANDDNAMSWFFVGSQNLSKAAWGEKIKKQDGPHFYIQHWELGVFVCPKLLGNVNAKLVPVEAPPGPNASKSYGIPLPYKIQPDRYGSDDVTWAVDRVDRTFERQDRDELLALLGLHDVGSPYLHCFIVNKKQRDEKHN